MTSLQERKSLRTFPIEIRNMIYSLLLQDTWDEFDGQSKVQSILAALRADPGIYKEALAVFYKTNTFRLSSRNVWLAEYFIQHNGVRFMDTCVVSLTSTLQRLYIQVPLTTPQPGPLNGLPSQTPTFDRTARIVRMAQNLTHIHIEPSPSNGCRTQWLALICDLIGPADVCPVLQQLKITWSAYMIDRFGIAMGFTILSLNTVLATPGRLEGPLTGDKTSWVWEHRGIDKGKPLKWNETIVLTLMDMFNMEWYDVRLYTEHQIWAVRQNMPSIFLGQNIGTPQERFIRHREFPAGVDYSPDTLLVYDNPELCMWRNVDQWEFLTMKNRCEREQQRGSLIHHEKDNSYVLKWLFDQGFECDVDPIHKRFAIRQWCNKQCDYGNPSQRGSEGQLDYIPTGVEVDEFEAASRAASLDLQPTAPRHGPPKRHRKHSALPSDWSRADSDADLSENSDVSDLLMGREALTEERSATREYDPTTSGDTELLEDMVFCPNEARYQIREPRASAP
ncbi:hypothetical protein NHQ30_005589 [Ciborinia camelliae]|nr:hypothetical protein NHQ30_005589 [Ciborinia camelliae]